MIQHDWRDGGVRDSVATALARTRGLALTLRLGDPPHARRLELTLADGGCIVAYLDQGFGAWTPVRPTDFDFRDMPAAQAAQLARRNTLIASRGETFVVLQRA